jgi:hypothetical protein
VTLPLVLLPAEPSSSKWSLHYTACAASIHRRTILTVDAQGDVRVHRLLPRGRVEDIVHIVGGGGEEAEGPPRHVKTFLDARVAIAARPRSMLVLEPRTGSTLARVRYDSIDPSILAFSSATVRDSGALMWSACSPRLFASVFVARFDDGGGGGSVSHASGGLRPVEPIETGPSVRSVDHVPIRDAGVEVCMALDDGDVLLSRGERVRRVAIVDSPLRPQRRSFSHDFAYKRTPGSAITAMWHVRGAYIALIGSEYLLPFAFDHTGRVENLARPLRPGGLVSAKPRCIPFMLRDAFAIACPEDRSISLCEFRPIDEAEMARYALCLPIAEGVDRASVVDFATRLADVQLLQRLDDIWRMQSAANHAKRLARAETVCYGELVEAAKGLTWFDWRDMLPAGPKAPLDGSYVSVAFKESHEAMREVEARIEALQARAVAECRARVDGIVSAGVEDAVSLRLCKIRLRHMEAEFPLAPIDELRRSLAAHERRMERARDERRRVALVGADDGGLRVKVGGGFGSLFFFFLFLFFSPWGERFLQQKKKKN